MESTTGYTFTHLCGIFYFPWHRHQIEGTNGFYCLIRKTQRFTISNVESQVFTPNNSRLDPGSNPGCPRDKRIDVLTTTGLTAPLSEYSISISISLWPLQLQVQKRITVSVMGKHAECYENLNINSQTVRDTRLSLRVRSPTSATCWRAIIRANRFLANLSQRSMPVQSRQRKYNYTCREYTVPL